MPEKNVIILTDKTKKRLRRLAIAAAIVGTTIYIHRLQQSLDYSLRQNIIDEETISVLHQIIAKK